MNLYESAQDYLERILMLSQELVNVRSVDIARSLNFSKPSVSIAMKKLSENGYIEIDANAYIHLTEKGKEIANAVFERHKILTSILVNLGVEESVAKLDACKVEHDLSEETFAAIKKYYYNNLEK